MSNEACRQVAIYLEPVLREKLKAAAAAEGRPVSNLARLAVKRFLEQAAPPANAD
jgi:hypothetical protein